MHTTLAYIAIGALALGLAVELWSFRDIGRRAFRSAGRWLVLIGVLACAPAATTGMCAYYEVVRNAGEDEPAAGARPWYRLVRDATPHLSSERWAGLERHAWAMAGGTVAVMIAAVPVLLASVGGGRRGYRAGIFALVVLTGWMGWE